MPFSRAFVKATRWTGQGDPEHPSIIYRYAPCALEVCVWGGGGGGHCEVKMGARLAIGWGYDIPIAKGRGKGSGK